KLRGIVEFDQSHATFTREDPLPQILDLAAQRRYGSQASDNYAAFHLPHLLFNVVNGFPDRLDLLRGVVGNVDVELFFQLHHQFDGVQAVSTDIVDEVSILVDLILAHAELLGHNINHAFFHGCHRTTLQRYVFAWGFYTTATLPRRLPFTLS